MVSRHPDIHWRHLPWSSDVTMFLRQLTSRFSASAEVTMFLRQLRSRCFYVSWRHDISTSADVTMFLRQLTSRYFHVSRDSISVTSTSHLASERLHVDGWVLACRARVHFSHDNLLNILFWKVLWYFVAGHIVCWFTVTSPSCVLEIKDHWVANFHYFCKNRLIQTFFFFSGSTEWNCIKFARRYDFISDAGFCLKILFYVRCRIWL
jgi:hypothetical protein